MEIGIRISIVRSLESVKVTQPDSQMSQLDVGYPGQGHSHGERVTRITGLGHDLRASLVIDAEALILVDQVDVSVEGNRVSIRVIPETVAS